MRIGGLALLVVPLAFPHAGAAPQLDRPAGAAVEDLFSRLDADGDGHLGSAEMQSALAAEGSWIAVDRDRDERIGREEFQAMEPAPAAQPGGSVETAQWSPAGLRGGYSALRLLGAPAHDFHGERLGVVRDILVAPSGAVTALLVGSRRVPWIRTDIGPQAAYVGVPSWPSAVAGGTAPAAPVLPRPSEWRASRFLGGSVQIEPGVRYAGLRDLIILPSGQVGAIVVDKGPLAEPGFHAYPWGRPGELRPFDYRRLGIAGPR